MMVSLIVVLSLVVHALIHGHFASCSLPYIRFKNKSRLVNYIVSYNILILGLALVHCI